MEKAKMVWKIFVQLMAAFWKGFGEGAIKYLIIAVPLWSILLLGLAIYLVCKGETSLEV